MGKLQLILCLTCVLAAVFVSSAPAPYRRPYRPSYSIGIPPYRGGRYYPRPPYFNGHPPLPTTTTTTTTTAGSSTTSDDTPSTTMGPTTPGFTHTHFNTTPEDDVSTTPEDDVSTTPGDDVSTTPGDDDTTTTTQKPYYYRRPYRLGRGRYYGGYAGRK